MQDRTATRVLLAVVDPASTAALARVALDVAGRWGDLRALTVVPPGAGTATRAEAVATLAAVQDAVTRLGGRDVPVELVTEVVEADHPAVAVHDVVDRDDVDVVVMGWQGQGNAASSFGRIVDEVVGRSRVPLLMVREGTAEPASLLVAFDTDQLHPAGRRGLVLAGAVAASMREARGWPVTLLQTGADEFPELPAEIATLTDRIHHDPRRRHDAVAAAVDASTVLVAPVAPTVAGLRAATTRLNWAAGVATMVVAVDVGPVGPREDLAGAATSRRRGDRSRAADGAQGGDDPPGRQGVALTISSVDPVARRPVMDALADAGEVGTVRTWWEGRDQRPHLAITVTVDDATRSDAIGAVMAVADRLPELVGARVRYDLVEAPTPLRLRELRPLGPLGELNLE